MKTIVEHLTENFPSFSAELKQEILRSGRLMHLKAGETLMNVGEEFLSVPLITEGSIKVLREDEEGHELFLYFLTPGQTCALSLNCILMSRPSEVHASAEEDTTLIALDTRNMADWIAKYPDWRNLVINTYQLRFHEMLNTIDGIAFKQLDDRLLIYLKEKITAHHSNEISITHQQIADDLNSTREVISRLLKILEKQHKIKLSRGKIEVL